MANTTFNGPVRSEGGFEQITKNSTTGAITTNLDVDTSGNISTTGTLNNLFPVTLKPLRISSKNRDLNIFFSFSII